jgi:hypothetical protein
MAVLRNTPTQSSQSQIKRIKLINLHIYGHSDPGTWPGGGHTTTAWTVLVCTDLEPPVSPTATYHHTHTYDSEGVAATT